MDIRYFIRARAQARVPSPRERILVASEDPKFWLALRHEADGIEAAWVLANSARECLLAVEDSRVKLAIIDGTLNDKPANQLLPLLRQLRPDLQVVFAYHQAEDDLEREARQAGVLYYGDRSQLSDLIHVVRESVHRTTRPIRRGRG
jgi:DNA-binding NtrC family response regulator